MSCRRFNGTSDTLASAATLDLSAKNKITVSFWLEWDTYGTGSKQALEFSASAASNLGSFNVVPDGSGGAFEVAVDGATGTYKARISVNRPAAAVALHHIVLLLDRTASGSTNIITVYVDGVIQSGSSINNTAISGNFGNATLYAMSRAGASLFGAGDMANLSIHDGILTAAQIQQLFVGYAPASIGTCLYYWPMSGATSPEPATVGSTALTVTGTTQGNGGFLTLGRLGSGGIFTVSPNSNAGMDLIVGGLRTSDRLFHAQARDNLVGNPAPSLRMGGAGAWDFFWAVKAGTQTLQVDCLYAPNLPNGRPQMRIYAQPALGIPSDVVGIAPSGTGWVTIGPLTVHPTADGVLRCQLWSPYVGPNNERPGILFGAAIQSVNWDNLAAGSQVYGFDLWHDGVPYVTIGQALPGVGGGSVGYGFAG